MSTESMFDSLKVVVVCVNSIRESKVELTRLCQRRRDAFTSEVQVTQKYFEF